MKHSGSHAELSARMRALLDEPMPLPGAGQTPRRHRLLMELGREDLSLARLAEAHWDAVAILAEAGREVAPGAVYGVWAAEIAGQALQIEKDGDRLTISGSKRFCSGAGLVDRALVTVGEPRPWLIDVDLRSGGDALLFDTTAWRTTAFELTNTATASFLAMPVTEGDLIGEPGWYLSRPGFWHGACGPAACWAGGAVGLVDWALTQPRNDPHTLAHLGAMRSAAWELRAVLDTAGREIDADPAGNGHARAMVVRHLVEQAASDVLRRVTRAYGPHPLAFDGVVGRHYQELDLYLRQNHAERDLEALGTLSKLPSAG